MEENSNTESSELLGDWDSSLIPEEETILMVSLPTTPEESLDEISNPQKENQTRVSASTSTFTGDGKEEAARRKLPPWMDPSYEWGGGKCKEDGRKKTKEKEKVKEKEEIIPFKEIIEALLRNSGEKLEDEEKGKGQSCVEMFKSMGFIKFP